MRTLKSFHWLIALCVSLMLVSACSTGKAVDETNPAETAVVEDLYKQAQGSLESGLYETASQQFDDIERLHPYSVWAKRASLMSAYALYKNEDYDRAVVALDRFIQLHPADERVDYAYYLKAMSYYDQISDVRRDQKMTRLALDNLQEIVNRFPDSQYARDARLKIDLTIDHLAGQEMEIGRYYLRQRIYNAAIRRFKTVVDEYQTTTHTAEALYRLTESYMALGLVSEAKRNAAILGHNYPGSEWYQDAYDLVNKGEVNQEPGLFSKAWNSMTN